MDTEARQARGVTMSRFATIDSLPMPSSDEIARAVDATGGGVVYFVQCGDSGPIKIGHTTRERLKARLSVLQTGSPFPLHLRRVVAGTRQTEAAAQQFFRDLRLHGEWFYPDDDLIGVANGPWL